MGLDNAAGYTAYRRLATDYHSPGAREARQVEFDLGAEMVKAASGAASTSSTSPPRRRLKLRRRSLASTLVKLSRRAANAS